MAAHQHDARGSDVERQAQQRGKQQDRGNELKSSGFSAFIAAIRIATDRAMLSTKNTSSSIEGSGTIISTMSMRMPAGRAMAPGEPKRLNMAGYSPIALSRP
jgi:hypothetical protein